jgi:5-methylcytosine-specific restriction enzyme A
MFYNEPLDISAELWTEILADKKVTTEKDMDVLSLIYRSKNHEMRASDIALMVKARNHGAINLQIYNFSKRVLEKTRVKPSWMKEEQYRWWHVPFLGYDDEDRRHFPWIMRPELVTAFDNILGFDEAEIPTPEEISEKDSPPLPEGSVSRVLVNRYERNKQARDACIAHYGNVCIACGFDFEQMYGAIGKNKIHVHHLIPLSRIQQKYIVDPVQDLQPICPNCHLIIHSKTEPFTIEEVKEMIKNSHRKK